MRDRIIQDILEERTRQDKKWGGPEHDDQHNIIDWSNIIKIWNRKVRNDDVSLEEARRRFIQVAALAVAAVEVLDRRKL